MTHDDEIFGSLDGEHGHLTVRSVRGMRAPLQDCRSPFLPRYASGIDVLLDWNREHLPDVLLRISPCGRAHEPWNRRNRALGIEPCNACFDLTRVARAPDTHPLSHRRGLDLREGMPVRIDYRITARLAEAGAARSAARRAGAAGA